MKNFFVLFSVNGRPESNANDDYDLTLGQSDPDVQNDNNYDYEDGLDDDGDSELQEATITTRPQDFVAKKGETVRLPCEAKNAGKVLSSR